MVPRAAFKSTFDQAHQQARKLEQMSPVHVRLNSVSTKATQYSYILKTSLVAPCFQCINEVYYIGSMITDTTITLMHMPRDIICTILTLVCVIICTHLYTHACHIYTPQS